MSRYKKKFGIRDPRQIIIAVEGAKREKQYFDWFSDETRRVRVAVLFPHEIYDQEGNKIDDVGKVKPHEILERLVRYAESPENYIEEHDQIWIVADADKFNQHHEVYEFSDEFANEGRLVADNRYIALSMYCFEVWLLLHKQDFPLDKNFKSCPDVKQYLESIGGFDSTQDITVENIKTAISRAQKLDEGADALIPNMPGTKIYRLAETLLWAIKA